MDSKQVFEQLEKINGRLGSIDTTLAVNTSSLQEHMRRTAIIEGDLKPIKAHVSRIDGALMVLGGLATLAGLIASFYKMLS